MVFGKSGDSRDVRQFFSINAEAFSTASRIIPHHNQGRII
jgi:hypothetical protein